MQHHYRTHRHRWVLTITEMPDKVVVAVAVDPPKPTRREFRRFRRWSLKYLQPYDRDPRPFEMTNPLNGEVAIIGGNENRYIAAFFKRSDLH